MVLVFLTFCSETLHAIGSLGLSFTLQPHWSVLKSSLYTQLDIYFKENLFNTKQYMSSCKLNYIYTL